MDTILQSHVQWSGPTVGEFKAWLRSAQVGDLLIYHCGFLALGMNHLGDVLAPAERQQLAAVAHCAWVAAQHGQVHLLQRRLGEACFEYFAVVRPQTAEPSTCRAMNSSVLWRRSEPYRT
jgi:hypothetical protein